MDLSITLGGTETTAVILLSTEQIFKELDDLVKESLYLFLVDIQLQPQVLNLIIQILCLLFQTVNIQVQAFDLLHQIHDRLPVLRREFDFHLIRCLVHHVTDFLL